MPSAKKSSLALFLQDIEEQVQSQIEKAVSTSTTALEARLQSSRELKVVTKDRTQSLKGLKHEQLPLLITVAGLRQPALMVGMAGTGKTHASEQVAEALGLDFYSMSVGAQTSKSDIIGYMNAGGGYVSTQFRNAYEQGGVFLMDEIDAGNANVLIQINSALSNRQASFPDSMVKMHKDFVFIATANTYGTGMNRQYVGRNQLDAATLDRFTVVDWAIDANLEQAMATQERWYEVVKACREYVMEHEIRALITPRATVKGCQLLDAGLEVGVVIGSVLLNSVPDDRKEELNELALKTYTC